MNLFFANLISRHREGGLSTQDLARVAPRPRSRFEADPVAGLDLAEDPDFGSTVVPGAELSMEPPPGPEDFSTAAKSRLQDVVAPVHPGRRGASHEDRSGRSSPKKLSKTASQTGTFTAPEIPEMPDLPAAPARQGEKQAPVFQRGFVPEQPRSEEQARTGKSLDPGAGYEASLLRIMEGVAGRFPRQPDNDSLRSGLPRSFPSEPEPGEGFRPAFQAKSIESEPGKSESSIQPVPQAVMLDKPVPNHGQLQMPDWLNALGQEYGQKAPHSRTQVEKETVVNVTIGRIEVRAVHPQPPSKPRSRRQPVGVMTLEEYLKRRECGGQS